MLIGYCRTSAADQNPDHQIDALLHHGVDRDNIHVDVASGAKASRPKLDLVMQLLREGDTLKVTRLDRLSRSVLHMVTLGAELRERGIGLHVIGQGIDTATMEGRAMFGMLSVLAELQRELIVANTNDGLASARARGRVGGRRPKLTEDLAPGSPLVNGTPTGVAGAVGVVAPPSAPRSRGVGQPVGRSNVTGASKAALRVARRSAFRTGVPRARVRTTVMAARPPSQPRDVARQ